MNDLIGFVDTRTPRETAGEGDGPVRPAAGAGSGWADRAWRSIRAAARLAGEMLTSPSLLIADLLHRERTLTRRTLIAYLLLLSMISALGWGNLLVYRQHIESAWSVLGSYWQQATELPVSTPHADVIRLFASEHSLDPALLAAVIETESSFEAEAVSKAGARGLMQIMPATWRALALESGCDGAHAAPACGLQCIFDPTANVRAGTAYLASLLADFNGSFVAAFAAYHAGAAAVRAVEPAGLLIPPYVETENYVRAVLAGWSELRAGPPGASPVRRLLNAGQASFAPAGAAAALWVLFLAWALVKGRRTGHLDALV